MKEKIIELEKRIAFMDDKLEELNEVICDQSKVIDELKGRLEGLKDQVQSGALVRKIEDEDPPPHY